jgi:hypothetical protein
VVSKRRTVRKMMARKRFRFRKRADKDLVFLPGVGRVAPGQILEGPEFKQFCPELLERIEDPGDNGAAKAPESPVKAAEEIKEPEPPREPEVAPEPPPAPVGPSVVESPEDFEEPEPVGAVEEQSDLSESAESETAGQTSAKMKRRAAARRKRRTT